MANTVMADDTALDPERPWITDPEDLPSRMNWFQILLNPMGKSPKLHFTRAWTALFFTQLILWFGVSTMMLGIAGLIGADVSQARIFMTYVLAAVFIFTTLFSFIIHSRRLNHAGRASSWAIIVLIPLILALAQFTGAVMQNSTKYTERYDARATYLADPVGWRDAQLEKRRAAQIEDAAEQTVETDSTEEEQTVEECLASKKEQDSAVEEGGREADGENESGRSGRDGRGGRGGGDWAGASDPTALADQALPSQEEFILRPAVAGITSTIMMLSIPVAIWSLLFVARAPILGPVYPRRGLVGILFSRSGRIGRQQFWAGLLVNLLLFGLLFGLFSAVSNSIPAAGIGIVLAGILFVAVQCLITTKRLHDMGESARRMFLPWLVSLGLVAIGGAIAFLQMAAIQAQMAGCGGPAPTASYIAGGAIGFAIVAMHVGFLLLMGLGGPDLDDETYGPAPLRET